MPWGISESAYNARDLEQTYQYSSFGVPGLGSEARAAARISSIAPYATALGAMIRPRRARRRTSTGSPTAGAAGRYGFCEALDYTARAAARGRDRSRS